MDKIQKAYETIEKALQGRDLAALKGENARLELNITGDGGGVINLKISEGNADLAYGEDPGADCRFTVGGSDFERLVSGKVNPMFLVLTGKLQIKGDIAKAKKLAKKLF